MSCIMQVISLAVSPRDADLPHTVARDHLIFRANDRPLAQITSWQFRGNVTLTNGGAYEFNHYLAMRRSRHLG